MFDLTVGGETFRIVVKERSNIKAALRAMGSADILTLIGLDADPRTVVIYRNDNANDFDFHLTYYNALGLEYAKGSLHIKRVRSIDPSVPTHRV